LVEAACVAGDADGVAPAGAACARAVAPENAIREAKINEVAVFDFECKISSLADE
jgi:hypothetical protein